MSTNNPEQPKKSSSVLEKLGQKLNTIKDDIADNLERRKQSYNSMGNNQVHFITRTVTSDDSLIIEKQQAPSPTTETNRRIPSNSESDLDRTNSLSNSNKRNNNETTSSTTELPSSCSYHDLFSCENSEQAREMIINDVRQEHHSPTMNATKQIENSTKLLAGPRFRAQSSESRRSFMRDTIYPVSGAVGAFSILIALWKPISPFISGFLVGFLISASIAYIIIRLYLNTKNAEQSTYEWFDFAGLETHMQDMVIKCEKRQNLQRCGEIAFGCYDADRDEQFVRYPAVIRLDNYRLIIQLPTKAKSDEKKEKDIKFIGYREYWIKEANLMLVPEITLTRVKYWLNEYPIVIQNLQILDKQILNKQSFEKSKFDTDDFFNNPQTTLSLFFETGPDKEEWFLQLSIALRKGKEDIERVNRVFQNTSSLSESSPSLASVESATANFFSARTPSVQSNLTNSSDRASLKSFESNETSNENETNSTRTRTETSEKDKDNSKKKTRKIDENLQRLLDSKACLDEAALSLNFLFRRLFCDVFQEKLFLDWLRVKIELKLKEIGLSVLEGLRVEKIEMGNSLPIVLRIEPMQWNTKGLWFNLFIFYRGSFKTTIKTRIVLQRLLNSNATNDASLSVHFVNKDDDHYDEEELLTKNKSTTNKEPEVAESIAAKRLGHILTRVAANKHVQRIVSLKPVAGALEKLSNAEVGVNIELLNISGLMTINIPPPPSDRIWIGFSEMPDLNLKVTPVVGDSQYSYTLIHDFLESRIREEIRRLLVLPSMDDQLLPFMNDWVSDFLQENR